MGNGRGSGGLRVHRSHQLAILDVLKDGKDHHKDDMKMAGMRACDTFDALGTYQRKFPEQEKLLESLGGKERSDEALRQQVEGSRILVGKAMSHLVDRGLMEVASKNYKGQRETYRITKKGKEFLKNPPEDASNLKTQETTGEKGTCKFCEKELFVDDPSTWVLAMAWTRWEKPNQVRQGRLAPDADVHLQPIPEYAHERCFDQAHAVDEDVLRHLRETVAERFGFEDHELYSPSIQGQTRYPTLLARQVVVYLAHHLVTNDGSLLCELVNRKTSFITTSRSTVNVLMATDEVVEINGEEVSFRSFMEELKAEIGEAVLPR